MRSALNYVGNDRGQFHGFYVFNRRGANHLLSPVIKFGLALTERKGVVASQTNKQK